MKTYIIDTNALISFVTNRNVQQQAIISEIFEASAQLKVFILCHQIVLTEFVYVMDKVYRIPKTRINQMVGDMIAMPGVRVVHEIDFKSLLKVWPKTFSDFADAIIASVSKAKEHKGGIVVTFDQKFSKTLMSIGANVIPGP